MTHRIATAKIEGVSPYSQSRYHATESLEKEGKDAYARRTWREYVHTDRDGNIIIPPMAMKNCLSESVKFLGIQIPGKGKSTYTKHFEAGILVTDPSPIGHRKDDLTDETHLESLFLPSDGRRGSGSRVMKYFPRFDEWSATVQFHIFDDVIPKDVFKYVLEQAGQFIGIGRFRPRNNGFYGRFVVNELKWSDE